jgi:predicted aspartyl protease
MGVTYIKILVCNPFEEERQKEVELLIDTGAMISVIPRQILEGLGIKPRGKRRLGTFGGGAIERDVGPVLLKYEDRFTFADAAFGEKDDTPILGVTALETMGYQVDPVTKTLKRVDLSIL